MNVFPNCGVTEVYGLVLDTGGGLAGDIWIRYWTDGYNGSWTQSEWVTKGGTEDAKRNWDGFINDHPINGTWYVCVVPERDATNCLSNRMDVAMTAEPCAPESGGVQSVKISFQKN